MPSPGGNLACLSGRALTGALTYNTRSAIASQLPGLQIESRQDICMMEHPRLLPKLRTALTCLYDDGSQPHHRHEAHDFLLGFKGSNLRRAVVSRVKSQRDRGSVADGTASIGDIANNPIDEDVGGSIYLSCLALLLQSFNGQNVAHESIFAAQTLNHRCRSIKLAETLDIEAEDGVECGMAKIVLAWEEMKSERAMSTCGAGNPDVAVNWLGEKSKMILDAWVERYVPMIANTCCSGSHAQDTICDGADLLSLVLQRHSSPLLGSANNTDGEKREEEIKGTLIMLTLAVAMYTASFCATVEEHQHQQMQQHSAARPAWANSVLSDLGSALSVTALRIRYRPLPDKHATPQPESSCPPLIDMLVNTMKMVGESAEVYLSQKIQQPQSVMQTAHTHAMQQSVAACMKSLPETVLLPAGHDTGHRIPSIDRACLRAASMELRSVGGGMDKAWKVIAETSSNGQSQDSSATQLLECCEAWARYVAVPLDLVNTTVGSLAVEYLHVSRDTLHSPQTQKAQTAAFQYLVSIFESASPSLTAEDILTAALGVGASGHTGKGGRGGGGARKNANTKKKQGNKSKKRHEKRLGRAVAVQDCEEGNSADAAEQELLARRNAACVAAAAVFGVSLADASSMDDTWGLRPAASSPSTTTHGVCSTVASAISSVLPHLLHLERQEGESNTPWRVELFKVLAGSLRQICAALTREIRALAYEPLMILHTSLHSVAHVSFTVEQVAVEIICECTQALATSSGYPPGYFNCLTENNDEELEIERNDIRDVARSVCSLDACDLDTAGQKSPSILILERIVTACNAATQQSDLPPETVVHILSALAKPLNKLGKICNKQPSATGCAMMTSALQAFGTVCDRLNASFDSRSVSEILPLSRLALMGAASLTPMFGKIAEAMGERPAAIDEERELFTTFERTLLSSLQHSMLSTANLPELAAASTLSWTRYDIKGAMRGPGGEDHVGCIALLRFASESDCLTSRIFQVYGPALLDDLLSLYNGLKASELERGVGCDHGIGVTPISRRLVLRVVSRLALHGANEKGGIFLQQLVQAPLVEMRSQRELAFSAEKSFRLCEAAYDLSFFSPELVADLFDTAPDDLAIMFESVVTGYSRLSFASDDDASCQQWGRLRGAVHSALATCLKSTISSKSANIIAALIKAECDAATTQCNRGPESGSNLFIDAIVGEEMVSAGVYSILIKDCLKRIGKTKGRAEKCMVESQTCLSLLQDVAPAILPLLLHQSPEASAHVDPRPTIAEAWFLALESLVLVCRNSEQIASSLADHGMTTFLGDSLSVAMALIFLKDVGTKHSAAPDSQNGMSLDGPQTLALERFVTASLLLGPNILAATGKSVSTLIQVPGVQGQGYEGAVILIAAIMRGISGAVPPWLVEEAPDLFRSLYTCVGCDCDQFMLILDASTKIKASAPFGGVRAGELLAGRYLDCSSHHLTTFLSKSKDVCTKGDWRRLKVVLKAACGGKKKDAGFNLKPQYTSWECDRL
ncbi:hypothetical protein ACHAXT_007824 [Thalassiosira profunda]